MRYEQLPLYVIAILVGSVAVAAAGIPLAVVALVAVVLVAPVVMMALEHRLERVVPRHRARR